MKRISLAVGTLYLFAHNFYEGRNLVSTRLQHDLPSGRVKVLSGGETRYQRTNMFQQAPGGSAPKTPKRQG